MTRQSEAITLSLSPKVILMSTRGFQEYRQVLVESGLTDNQALRIANNTAKEWLIYANEADMKAEALEQVALQQIDFSYDEE